MENRGLIAIFSDISADGFHLLLIAENLGCSLSSRLSIYGTLPIIPSDFTKGLQRTKTRECEETPF